MTRALSTKALSTNKTQQNTAFYQLLSKHVNLCRTKGYKTLKNTAISCLICKICLCLKLQNIDKNSVFYQFLPKDYAPLPHNWLQNTVDYGVLYPCSSNGSSLLGKQLAPKPCKIQCFLPLLKQWFKPSCQTTCSKTL